MKKIIAILMISVAVILGGCNAETTTSNSGKGSIDPAVFCMEDQRYPRISIKENNNFAIALNNLATDTIYGTYTVNEDESITLTGDNGSVYNFAIERKALVFDAADSDAFVISAEDGTEVEDGAEFELWRKYE